jgi:sulfotransferase family protein
VRTPALSRDTGNQAKAQFFLVGAPKAGTTSIDRLLRDHPDVFLTSIKEPCHFCPDVAEQLAPSFSKKQRIDIASYLASAHRRELGLAWVASADDYARLFEGADGRKVIGECSTFYLSSKAAPAAIHAYNPDARIVAVLRRPVDRIRSHYEMDRVHGVTGRPLLSLVEEELALGDDANWGNCAYYVGASRYSRQLQMFYRFFEPESVCVLSFEKLVADPEVELGRLFEFLGIPAPAGPLALPSANRARSARFPGFNRALHASGLKPLVSGLLKRALPQHLERAAKSTYYRRGSRVVSDDELSRLARLLQDAGVESEPAYTG